MYIYIIRLAYIKSSKIYIYMYIILVFISLFNYTRFIVSPTTQGTWRSNDYVSTIRLVDYIVCIL